MIKAVIFDMDGLLIDSEPLWRKAEMMIFETVGISLTEEDCRKTIGMRIDEVVKYWSEIYHDKNISITEVTDAINQSMLQLIKSEGKAMSGVYEIIDLFKSKNIPMAIASSSSLSLIEQVATQLHIKSDMEFLHSAYEMDYGKPHPQVFIETGLRLKVRPENCLVFEDSIYGVIAARAAMMNVVAVPDSVQFGQKEFNIAHKELRTLTAFNQRMLSSF